MTSSGQVAVHVKATEKPGKQRYSVMCILLVTLLVSYLDRVNISVLIADNKFLHELGIAGNPVYMGLLTTLFLAPYGLSNGFLSPIGDWLGPRKTTSLAIVLWGLALTVGGFASVFFMLGVSRVLLGLGEGLHWPVQSKYVKNWFPPAERGKANALWIVGVFLGPTIAMPFFASIVSAWGWRATFFILVALGIIPLLLIWFFTTDHPAGNKRVGQAELDLINVELQQEDSEVASRQAAGFRANAKLFFSNWRYWVQVVQYCTVSSMTWGMIAWLPSYLKVSRGFSFAKMGLWSSLPYFMGVVGILAWGVLSDKTGRSAPWAMIGHTIFGVGLFFGAFAKDPYTCIWLISIGLLGNGGALVVQWTILQRLVPARVVATGGGFMNMCSNLVASLAPIIMGALIASTGSYVGGLMYLVGLAVIGFTAASILTLQKL
jgi:sugar phosphate permease